MVSILRRRHFVPNPVVMHSTGFRAKRRGPLSIHTWYDGDGNQLSETDADGDTTTNVYNDLGQLVGTIDAAGKTTSYAYDAAGNQCSETDPDGNVTTSSYNDLGQLVSTTDAAGGTTRYTYDADGNELTETDPLGRVTSNAYNDLDQLVSTTDAAGGVTRYTYNADGDQLTETDPLGHVTTDSYNDLGQLVCTTDAAGGTTRYKYNADGDQLSETDPDGNETIYGYDSMGQRTSQTQTIEQSSGAAPTTATTTYQYNADGDMVQETDADGRVTVFQYDALNRETGEQWYPNASDAASETGATDNIALTYDDDGNLLAAHDDFSSYTYAYDSLGEQTSVDNNGSGPGGTTGTPGVPDVVLSSAYDTDGNRTQLSATIDGTADFVNTYSYDDLNQETQVTQGASTVSGHDAVDSKLVNFTYNADGQLASIDRFAGASSQEVAKSVYGYDSLGRATSLTQTIAGGTTPYTTYAWTYDADSEVTSFTNSAHAGESVATYSYDHDGQLIGATPVTGQTANPSNSLSNSYDANGNATSTTVAGTTTTTTTGAGNTVVFDGTYSYQYDADGNMTARWKSGSAESNPGAGDSDISFFTWDNRNRMTSVTIYDSDADYNALTPDQTIAYTYDLFDNLIGRTVTTYASGVETGSTTQRYVFDGKNMVLAFDGNGNLTDRYLWGPAVDQVLADENYSPGSSGESENGGLPTSPGTTLWTLGDNQNSVRDLVVDSGALVQHVAYTPFGQQLVLDNGSYVPQVAFAIGYTGTYTDPTTGLQLHGVRWYDPSVGRWLSEDPAAADSNLYRYCGNAPTDGTDPSGMAAMYPPSPMLPAPWEPGYVEAVLAAEQQQQQVAAAAAAQAAAAQAEKDAIIAKTQKWGEGGPGGRSPVTHDNMCEDQSIRMAQYVGATKYWVARGVKGTRNYFIPTLVPTDQYLGWALLFSETENAVGFFPNPKTNPNGVPFVIDAFGGYDNDTGGGGVGKPQSLEDFFRKWPAWRDTDSWTPKPPVAGPVDKPCNVAYF